jgi:hypothetical protein
MKYLVNEETITVIQASDDSGLGSVEVIDMKTECT